ncbi:unnamed protein product, partial [Linum tenue]
AHFVFDKLVVCWLGGHVISSCFPYPLSPLVHASNSNTHIGRRDSLLFCRDASFRQQTFSRLNNYNSQTLRFDRTPNLNSFPLAISLFFLLVYSVLGGKSLSQSMKKHQVNTLDPGAFSESFMRVLNESGGDFAVLSKSLERSDLELSKYGDRFFEVVFLGSSAQSRSLVPVEGGGKNLYAIFTGDSTEVSIQGWVTVFTIASHRRPAASITGTLDLAMIPLISLAMVVFLGSSAQSRSLVPVEGGGRNLYAIFTGDSTEVSIQEPIRHSHHILAASSQGWAKIKQLL